MSGIGSTQVTSVNVSMALLPSGVASAPTAARAVFLDNQDDPQAIRAQIRRLIALALERKEAVAIGHATRLTPQILAETLAEFDRREIALVPISSLVK